MINQYLERILDRQNSNGGPFWSREDGNIYSPIGSATIDTLSVLGEIGISVNDHPLLSKAVDFVFTYQSDDGCFKYAPKSSKLPCLTSRIIAAFGRLGVKEERLEKSYKWILDTQCNDGGWRCATVKLGKSPLMDASNPGTTLYVLDAFRFRKNSSTEMEQLNRGVDFLLQHWEVRQPLGPCQFGIGTQFLKIEYPYLRYNIFYYVYVLSCYKNAIKDKRFLEAYKYLSDKVKDEKVIPENPHKAWQQFDFAKKGQVSKLASNRWKEITLRIK